jgi:DNA-binding transcriptional ArsR family regulator
MMHGHGPRILHALPKHGAGITTRELQANLEAGTGRAPSIETIRRHLFEMNRLGLVYTEKRRYWRLCDSVFDAPLPSELEA